MVVFTLLIGGIGVLLWDSLRLAFLDNVVINSVILAALFIGIVFTFRQTLRLIPEHRWMREVQDHGKKSKSKTTPSLLATVAVIMADEGRPASLSAQNLRSILDGVAVRLDESREISRYMIGLLVFLGLLGTFWGLLITIQSVGDVVEGIDTATGNVDSLLAGLKDGLNAPLAGMATAFSSSLFGLGGSLILGFLDLQLGQAAGRFFKDLEDWLSKSILVDAGSDFLLEDGTPLSEFSARELAETADQLEELTAVLNKLHNELSDNAKKTENLAAEIKADRKEMNETLSLELRALSKALMVAAKKKA
jgi:hypothetical protein